jgi:nicotinate-nucleotide pyrophosphorylase (carboxylating)
MTLLDPSLTLRLEQVRETLPESLRHPAVLQALQASLAEDLHPDADFSCLWPHPAAGDITSQATIQPDTWLEGRITAKGTGIVAGLPVAQAICLLVDPQIALRPGPAEGAFVRPGDILAEVSGPGPALLAAERAMLNFLGRMSGIATLTHQFVQAVAGTRAVILDTRKTVPGLRYLDKYAVRMGGGQNHRAGLYDMVLIKDNHIDGAGGIPQAVRRARELYGNRFLIEVEVKDFDELETALALGVDRIMLDNMDPDALREAVERVAGRVKLEASGNVTLETVRLIAETGVDFISSGALTHSARALDISLRLR